MVNIASMVIPMDFLTKIFLSYLHTDHWGDLAGLWAGGWAAGRPVSLALEWNGYKIVYSGDTTPTK